MDILNCLNPESVRCDFAARSRKHVLEVAAGQLSRAGGDRPGPEEIFDVLSHRERLGCTAMAHGVAIPHGRLPNIGAARGAFLRLAAPVDFEAPDGEPVDLIFAVLLPAEEAGEDQSRQLRELARMLSDPGLCRQLRLAPDADEIYRLLTGEPPRRTATG